MPKQRENWTSRVGFILAAAGSAIGLGNIWRFPFMTGKNGGAVFLVLYLLAILLIGFPVLINEMIIGRKTHRNPVGAFKALAPGTPWWLVGALGVFSGFVILSYYSVVAGWSLAYIYKTVAGGLNANVDFASIFSAHISNVIEPIIWHFIFMFLTIAVVAAGIVKGIQRSVKVLMPLLFILLIVLIGRAVTLPGAAEGLVFYLKPDSSAITPRTLLDAISQAFFTLSVGMGCIITYGSYMRDEDQIPGSAASVVGLDTLVAFMAGFAIFPAVFALGFTPNAGPGLTFITLPAVFAEMPMGILFGALFFSLLAIAALTSAFSLLEVVVAWLVDEYRWSRARASTLLGVFIFLAGIPASLGYSSLSGFNFLGKDLLDTYDWFANSIFLPLGGLLTAIFTGYVWGARKSAEEGNRNLRRHFLGAWWGVWFRYVIPVIIVVIMVVGIYDTFK
ncbi:MAG: sodium-dependent transporter [Firmicutes bacterium]|nr:sodium-dependent transporter [Bacillota bacterium]